MSGVASVAPVVADRLRPVPSLNSLHSVERAATPPAYASDPKYKKYTQQVDRCLSTFDSVHEWADFIAFLKQLLKTLQTYTQFKEIPRKVIISKRLSQCLNPALPTGVHQRALDVYSHIMAVLGSEGLQRDLALWSSGLFPFFAYAATSVKPTLLSLLDTYYIPLQTGLRPAMKSFVLALLPGLEEETGEYFDMVLGLLDRIAGTVSQSFFFQTLWLVMLTTPSARGTSLTFLSRRLPSLKANEDITSIVGRDIGLMIRAFSAALEDDDLLVRRSALDLLLQSLRIDSVAVKRASSEDHVILMRAACSVVLRRDLSLNRRLYSWLLGPEDGSQSQLEYFKMNSLDLLQSTLKDEMSRPSSEYAPSRPFKIFISLLDKWEIGNPLTEVLVYDALKALKSSLDSGADTTDDLLMTANTLYEAVEPQLLWKKLYSVLFSELQAHDTKFEGLRMIEYLLTTFHGHDEEIEHVHLPVGLVAVVELLRLRMTDSASQVPPASVVKILSLLQEMVNCIPPTANLLSRPQTKGTSQSHVESMGSVEFACALYGIQNATNGLQDRHEHVPLLALFHDLADLTSHSANALVAASPADIPLSSEVFVRALGLFKSLIVRLQLLQPTALTITWDHSRWLGAMLSCVESERAAFAIVDSFVTSALTLQEISHLQPRLSLSDRSVATVVISTLLKYLQRPWAAYHVRAVTLLLALDKSCQGAQLESVIAKYLASPDPLHVQEACEVFGSLWRLTDDGAAPGFRLKVPMMIVLNTLRSEDTNLRRAGETWMRCSLKSYLRVLDPILFDLLAPSIRRTPSRVQFGNREIQYLCYERPFDQRYIQHVLELLLSVVKFGGQGFSKTARGTPALRCSYPPLLARLKSSGLALESTTYMDVLLEILIQFLQSEPSQPLTPTMHAFNGHLQSVAIDLLQSVAARGELDPQSLEHMEASVVVKLFFCIHTKRLDVQNKLLHLLHTVISASHASAKASTSSGRPLGSEASDSRDLRPADSVGMHPLLTQTLVDGISVKTNHPILQHWLDFVLTTIPQFLEMMQSAVGPLCDTVCQQLRSALYDVRRPSESAIAHGDVVSYTTDADLMMLLMALERISLLSLSHLDDVSQQDDDGMAEKTQESSGLFGYVSNVFSSESPSGNLEDQGQNKTSDYRWLHEAVAVLYALWEGLRTTTTESWGSREESLTLISSRAGTRCRRVLEHVFRPHPIEVLESLVDCWRRDATAVSVFELVDVLATSAQTVVSMLCDSILQRTPGILTRRGPAISSVTDVTLFGFLEQYMKRLEGPVAIQVWGRVLQFSRDITGPMREFRLQGYLMLRCLTVLADKVTQTTAMEDRKLRKDLQDTYARLLDICLMATRPEQGSRRLPKESLILNGRDSPRPRVPSADVNEEKNMSSSVTLPEVRASASTDVTEQINAYLASDVLPYLRRFLVEPDRILSACNSIISSIVTPSLKGKSRPLDIEDNVLSLLQEMTKIQAAQKAWRVPISDAFNDNRCFNSLPESGAKWKPMIKALFDSDKTSLSELLGRITTASSANIFTNREYEMLLRSLNLRRLAYVLLAGEKNHYLTQLPPIQEKLVDTLRNVSAPVVQSEVYLCVRVLLCRLSPHNLASFWPTILTELYRLFEQVLATLPSDGSEELSLLLAACKLLDLLLVLQTEEFQIHQWIFITDTVDAVYRPDGWFPQAMLDRLAEVTSELPAPERPVSVSFPPASAPADERRMRRPMLLGVRQIDSARDLIPFFSGASVMSYESVYSSGGNVDWEAVERGLLEDMFDGR